MRIGVVSDVHGNLRAFEAVLGDVERVRPDLVVHGGDLALGQPGAAQVLDRVRELGWPGVLGNTEEALWALPDSLPPAARDAFRRRAAATAELIGPERLDWLRRLPMEYRWGPIAVTHAVPGDVWALVPDDASDARLGEVYGVLQAPIAVYGHIHVPFVRTLPGLTVANSGSVGMPFDGDTRASWLLISDGQVEVRRVEYDAEAAAADLIAAGLPDAEILAQSLTTGRFVPIGSK
jgi:putative phosphoesterase